MSNARKKCYTLPARISLQRSAPRQHTFITDREQIHFVLGESSSSWFEDATSQRLKQEGHTVLESHDASVLDSPMATPRISQLLASELAVGQSPVMHSSPYSQPTFHTPDMHWSPDVRKCWEKPELNLSPSPITQRLLAQSCRTPNGVSSLRLDDSALIWSNSLATPPRDTVHGSSSLLEEEMSKGKDPARMLFSPRERLNSTMDSITPLDSTAEEEQSDLSTSQTFTNLDSFKGPSQIPETEKTMVSNHCPNMEIHSMSNLDEKKSSQNGSHCNGHKVDNVTQNEESLGNMNTDRWKENFKKRLLERKNSNKDLSRRKISKNGSFVSQCLSQERQESTPIKIVSNDSSEDVSLSPTFSQKGVKVKSKQTKVQTNAVDDVLSDFFENLAEEQEKRPAPSRKRKSLELEAGQTKGDISIDEEGEAGVVAKRLSDLDLHSTPKGSSLKSILMSEQKRKSSGKKVRFSEEVREHFTFSESKSVLKGKSDSDMQKKRLIKKVKFNNEVKKQKSELSDSRVPKSYKICDSFDSNDLQGDTINNSSKESLKREVENISIKTKLKSCIDKVQMESERTKSRKVIDATDKASVSEILVHARSSHSQRDKLLDNIKEGSRKNSESGITETSLNIDSNKLSSVVKVNVKDDPIKQSEITCKSRVFKKFLYPSVSKNIQPSKRFQYNERTSMEGKISVLKPVYIQDIVSPASIVSEHTNEGTVKNNLGNQITLNNQSVCTEKDEESEANFKETRSSADSFPQKSTSICVTVGSVGFRSASGKKMVLSQEALHKAEQLLIEESGAKVNKKDESVAEVSKKGAGNDSVPHTMQNDQAEEDLEFSEWPEDFCEENEGFLLDEVVETAPESGDDASVNTKDKVVIEFTETNNKYAKQGMKKQSPSEYDKGYAASKSISRNRKEQLDGSQGEIVQISKDKIECENRNENDQLNMHSLGLISGSGKTLDIENETLQKANGLMIVSNLIEMRKKQPSSLVEEFKEQLALPVSGSSAISTRKDVNKSVQMVKYGGKGSKNTSMTVFPEADYSDSLEQDLMNQIQTLKTPSLDSTDFPFKDTTQNKMLSKPSKFPPGAVVPQGFRPFKPPKIMKTLSPKKEKKVLYPESKKIENVNRNKDMTSRQKDITTSDYNINTQDIGNMFDDEMTLTQCTADFENNNAGVTSKIIETSVGTASTVKSVFHDPTDDLTDKRTVHQHLDVKMKDIYSMTCSGDARWTGMKEMNTEIVYDVLETITCDSVTSVGKVKITSEKKHFSNDLKVGVFQGFSKASGSKINISEKAMKHARGILESDGNEDPFVPEVPNFQGFSSSSGIKHSISDNALKDVGGMLEPNDNKKQTVPEVSQFQGFSTASGSKENIPKKDLTHYRGVLETDVNEQCLVPEVPKFQGFSTASGSTVNISEKALKQARGMLESDDNEYPLVPEVPNCQGFSTSSGSKENISKRALKHDRGMLDPDYREKEKVSQFQGFSTVSESKVNVSNKSLKSARAVLESNNNKQLVEPDDPKFEGCSTESESKLNISVKALKHAHVMLESDNNEQTLVPEVPNFQWFSTSSRSKVNFPEKALKHAREMLESNNKDQHIVPEVSQFEGFSTVAESKVNISVMSLGHAREMLETGDDEPPLVPDVSKLQGFTKTLGSKECISENALKHLRGKFSDDTGQPLVPEVPQFQGFSTASGSKVNISEKALKHARGALESEDNEQFVEPEVPKFQGFSTASGRKVNISEKALNHASGVLASEGNKHFVEPKSTQFQGFSTASGIKVSISENALKHAKGILESGDFEQPLVPEVPKFQGFSTALGSKVNISEKALKHAKGVLESDDHEQPFVPEIPKFQGFSTALGSKVNISKKALKHVKGVLESDDNEQPFVPDLPKFQGFSTASGSKVSISEKALKHAKGVLESDDNEQPFLPDLPKFQGFSTSSGSKVFISETAFEQTKENIPSETSLDDGAEMKRYREHTNAYRGAVIDNGLVCKQDNKNRKRLLSVDDQETEFKRQKMDVETDLLGRGAHRKPLRSRPEGTTTDKRHPGFRPFKPVISKFQCKMTSQNISDIDQNATHQGPNTSGSVKPTFQTPYKTTPGPLSTDQPAKPNSSKSITPVFRPKQNIQFVQGNKTPSAEQGGMFKTEHSACSDIKSKPILGNTHKNMLDVKREIHEEKQDDKELEIGSSNIQTSFVVPEETSRNMESNVKETKDFDEGDGIGMKKVVAKDTVCDVKEIVDVAMETGDDEFSQGEDDIFYCDLLEARRHQDMLIKKREMDKVHPRVGRLFEMKKSSIRYQLSDLHDRLANYERPNFGVVSSTAADYKFNLADHYGQGTSHVLVGDGAYLVPDDAGLIGKQEFYRGFLTVESVDRKLISEAWVYNHYRWIVWKLAAYTLTFSSIAQRCFTPEMVMLQLKYRYDREIDRAERSSIKKIYEQDDTPGKRMVLCVAEIRSSVGEEGKQVQLYLSDGWYGIPAQVDSALTRLVLAGRIFVGQKLIMARAELVGGEDASTPLEAASSVMLKLGCNCVREARWDSRLGYQGNPQPLCVPLSTLQPDGGPLGVTDVVLVRKYPTMYMEKLSGGGCLFRSGSAEERARREFESRKQTEMEKLYSRLQEEMEIEDRQEKKGRGVRKFGDREVAALQTGEEIHDAIQSAAQPDTVQSYLSERQLELLYDHQRCLQDQKRADLAARVHAAWDVKEQAFQERQVTPMIKFRLAGCARKDMDSKTSVMLTVWRPSPEISELQEGHRYRIYNLNVGPTRGRSRGSSIQLTATKQTRFRKMVIDENFLDNVFEPREVLTVSDITERQAAYGEVDFVGLVIRMNHASMEGERGEDVMYLADWQGRLLALHFPAGIQAGGYELPREGEVWCCSSLQSRGRLLPSSLPTLTVSQEVTTLSTRPQGGLHRRAVDKLAQATKDKTIFLEKAKADLGDFLKDSNKCYTSSKAINPIKSIEEQLREDFGETSWQIMFEGDSSFSDIGEPQGDDGKGILPTTRQVYQTDIASNEECDNVAQVSQRCSSGSEEYTPVNNQFCSTDGDDIKQKISLETAMEVASTSEQTLGFPDSTEEFQKVTKQAPDCESLETPVKTSVNKSTSVSNQNVKNQTPIDPSQVVQASKLVHPPVPLTPTSTPHPPTPSPAQRPVVRAKIARLLSYGSPAALSPLNSVVPRSVIKTFKPPAFKKI